MEEAGEPLEEALLFALDDLRGDHFKRFKNQLCFLQAEGKPPLAWSQLREADPVDTLQLILHAYGREGAREAAVEALKAIGLRGSASSLQQWKRKDCRKRYQQHIRATFGSRWEEPIRPGAAVSLRQSYTDLLLARTPLLPETAHELLAVERKHREIEAHPEDLLEVSLETLYDSDSQSSRTTVLLGPAGAGKTTSMWKAMLDWASGNLWQERFDYVFYVPGGAVDHGGEPLSVVDLLLGSCPPGTLAAEDIFVNQDSILVIVDGLEDLKPPGLPSETLSGDLHRKRAPEDLVTGLLGRKLLARSHLLVTSRPTALGSLQASLKSPRFVEVLGFHPAQRKEYFRRFFGKREEATQAFETVRGNEALFGLCFLPALCWTICSVVRQKPQSHLLKEITGTASLTEIHMLLLFSCLEGCSRPSDLDALCSLARDGVLHKTMVLDEEVLKAHGLSCPDLEALSAGGWVLHRDAFRTAAYKFTHLSFQEFFAALSFLLEKEGSSSLADLNKVLGNKKELGGDHVMLVRFLFGLSSTRRLSALQKTWGCQPSRRRLLQELLRWVEEEAERRSFTRPERLMELCRCLYEAEDLEFAKSAMRHVPNLDLRDQLSSKLDFAALSFSLGASGAPHSLQLSGYTLGPAGLEQLLPGLRTSSDIQLNRCGLSTAECETLASVVETNQGLTTLALGENPLCDLGVTHLCSRLISSSSKLQSLQLNSCNLTAAACESLSRFLASNQHLTELDLGANLLGDLGVQRLCERLKHSRLQRLTLHSCGLTAAVCEDLASVMETSEALMELSLGDNRLGDEGVGRLSVALKRPSCRLQRLALSMNFLSRATKKKLQAACAARPQLLLVSYYPPAFPAFPGEDS